MRYYIKAGLEVRLESSGLLPGSFDFRLGAVLADDTTIGKNLYMISGTGRETKDIIVRIVAYKSSESKSSSVYSHVWAIKFNIVYHSHFIVPEDTVQYWTISFSSPSKPQTNPSPAKVPLLGCQVTGNPSV